MTFKVSHIRRTNIAKIFGMNLCIIDITISGSWMNMTNSSLLVLQFIDVLMGTAHIL